MATISDRLVGGNPDYPTSDGQPMAETDYHRELMGAVIKTLEIHFQADPEVYVSGNLLLFYEPGNKRRHVSPDVLVVRGVPKIPKRLNYITWEEGKAPDVVIELTSKTTRSEDVKKKKILYRDVLRVPEYILFDPLQDYLRPSMQGFRLTDGEYVPIEPRQGRIRSEVLGMFLEREGNALRFIDLATGRRVPTIDEIADRARADADRARTLLAIEHADRLRAEVAALTQELRADRAESENGRLRRELEELRRRSGGSGAD